MSCKAITDGNKCKQRDRNFKKVWKRSARSTELWHKWRMFSMDLPIALFSFIQELRYSYKQYKIHVIGIPEREETEKGTEEILKQ